MSGALAVIDGNVQVIWAKCTILASGGAGQLYRETTNPKIATADGHAMAYRAGGDAEGHGDGAVPPDDAVRRGFEPRAGHRSGSRRGRVPVDQNGYRFMADYTRRASWRRATSSPARSSSRSARRTSRTFTSTSRTCRRAIPRAFPQLAKLVDEFGIDRRKELIPIHPAAHYMIGGVDADRCGRTSRRSLRRRRGELFGIARRESAREQLAARRACLRRASGRRSGARGEGGEIEFPVHLEHRVTPSTEDGTGHHGREELACAA
jgi:L-aspartate oxidase